MAAYEGDLAKVKSAIESGMDANGIDPAQKLSALHMAAYNGHTETVNYLISKGAVVDARDSEKKTPLIHACTGPFAPTVKALIAAGADINATDGTEGFTPLMMAAGLGQVEIVEILLANKVTVDLKDEDQETAIDHARNAGHEAIVTRLETAMSEK
jgi:ankyrin repeat protein